MLVNIAGNFFSTSKKSISAGAVREVMRLTFFLIVPSVITVSVVLIHGISNRLGLRIHYIALAICAVLSIVSDAGAILLSPAPDKFYFIRLGGFIVISAAVGTIANYFLIRREVRAEEEFAEQVRTAYEEETEITVVESEPVKVAEIKISEPVEKKVEPIKKVDLVKKSKPKKISKPAVEKKVEPVKISAVEKVPAVEETPAVEKVAPKVEKTPEGKVVKKFEPEKITKSVKVAEKKISEPKEIILPNTDGNLDSLLDLAYSEKSQGHVWQAIGIYKKALEKYRADEYAPFVAIDLGNIYKEQAMYAKAIKIYEDALELPAVKRNFSTLANFKKNIIYLKSVQSVLLRHQALSTPFSKISKVYLQEIESEFQAAQLRID